MGTNIIQKNLKYLLIWIIFLGIIYFFKKVSKGNSSNNVNENEVQVEERGIRIRYNNKHLKINCGEYFLNGRITKEEYSDGLSKNEMVKLNNEMLLGLTDFTEEDMLIPWESINSWERFSGDDLGGLPHISVYVENMKIPFEIKLGLLGISKKVAYFKKMIPEKQKGIDPVIFKLILIILVPLLVLIFRIIIK